MPDVTPGVEPLPPEPEALPPEKVVKHPKRKAAIKAVVEAVEDIAVALLPNVFKPDTVEDKLAEQAARLLDEDRKRRNTPRRGSGLTNG